MKITVDTSRIFRHSEHTVTVLSLVADICHQFRTSDANAEMFCTF